MMTTHISTYSESKSVAKDIFLVFSASILICLFSNLSIYLPFTPVPIVTQNHAILLLALMLGAKRGFIATFLFLTYGALNFPVFAGSFGGIAKFFGPTGGYLIGYLCAAYFVGYMSERASSRTPLTAFTIMGLGSLIIHLCGFVALSFWTGMVKAVLLGFLPFVVGDIFKIVVGVKLAQVMRWTQKTI
ncbi:MAG: biotin transporter BioY [Chlamydiae bacterium CG10_big_fil_rev_8_21_14_0_10_35_9]|nr:MAG: biotin transporter BioY [Chlamydiae bacterium CG10_big_fil_rev_8_21_14_0_10_35_9]